MGIVFLVTLVVQLAQLTYLYLQTVYLLPVCLDCLLTIQIRKTVPFLINSYLIDEGHFLFLQQLDFVPQFTDLDSINLCILVESFIAQATGNIHCIAGAIGKIEFASLSILIGCGFLPVLRLVVE